MCLQIFFPKAGASKYHIRIYFAIGSLFLKITYYKICNKGQ
jgi:hypothetical protein